MNPEPVIEALEPVLPVRRPGRLAWLTHHGAMVLGAALFVAIATAALAAPAMTRHDPVRVNLRDALVPPAWAAGGSCAHPLGTDSLGRDLWARIVYGARNSLVIAGTGTVTALLTGVTLGLLGGLGTRPVRAGVGLLIDAQLAFPYILLAIAITSAVGNTSVPLLTLLMSLSGWVMFARVVRGGALQESEKDYVRAARIIGASPVRISLLYVLPNLLPAVVVIGALQFAAMIIFESTLSFLGMGLRPPTPSWGTIMLEGKEYLDRAWWVATLPGVAILLTSASLNLIADGLRSRLDPRMKVGDTL